MNWENARTCVRTYSDAACILQLISAPRIFVPGGAFCILCIFLRFCPSKIEPRAEPLFEPFSLLGIVESDLPNPEPSSELNQQNHCQWQYEAGRSVTVIREPAHLHFFSFYLRCRFS